MGSSPSAPIRGGCQPNDTRRQGKLRGKQPKLPPSAARTIRRRYADGDVSLADLAEEDSISRSTIHRIIHRPEPDTTAQQT